MREVSIIGVGMTRFGKWLERSMEDLGREAVWNALEDRKCSPHGYRSCLRGQRSCPSAHGIERHHRSARVDPGRTLRRAGH